MLQLFVCSDGDSKTGETVYFYQFSEKTGELGQVVREMFTFLFSLLDSLQQLNGGVGRKGLSLKSIKEETLRDMYNHM